MNRKNSIPGQSIRNTWSMNPVTRVHENDPTKNKKKERQNARKNVDRELNMLLREERTRKRWTVRDTDQRFCFGRAVSLSLFF